MGKLPRKCTFLNCRTFKCEPCPVRDILAPPEEDIEAMQGVLPDMGYPYLPSPL